MTWGPRPTKDKEMTDRPKLITGKYDSGRVEIDHEFLSPAKSQAIVNHSPDGFAWGYSGSGPSQLALALLLEFTDKETALGLYQRFKFEIIASLPQADFKMSTVFVKCWIDKQLNGGESDEG